MYRKIELVRIAHQLVLPFAQLISPPAGHRILVDTNNAPETFATGTGAQGTGESKKMFTGFLKGDAIGLKAVGEASGLRRLFAGGLYDTFAPAFVKSRLYRVGHPRKGIAVPGIHRQSVNQQKNFRAAGPLSSQIIFYGYKFIVLFYATEALLGQQGQMLLARPPLRR